MSKIALITDLHFGAGGDSKIIFEHQKKFYENVFFPFLQKNDIQTVINLGDTFDKQETVNYETLFNFKKVFMDNIHPRSLYTIVGNHDTYFRNTNKVNSPSLIFENYEYGTIFEEPEIWEFGENSLKVLMLPWVTSENEKKSIELIKKNETDIIMGHLQIKGYEVQKGELCEEGIDMALFDTYEMVMSGHFHKRQVTDPIIYLGTPYELTWNDHDVEKGFHIFDTKTRDLEFIKNPYKLHHMITYNDENVEDSKELVKNIDNIKGSVVRVEVDKKTNPELYEEFLSYIHNQNVSKLQIKDLTGIELDTDEEVDINEDISIITQKLVGAYSNTVQDQIHKVIKELHEKAMKLET